MTGINSEAKQWQTTNQIHFECIVIMNFGSGFGTIKIIIKLIIHFINKN